MPASDALGDAAKIADPLLLIHGMSDDNVVFENSTALDRRDAGRATVPFETMLYPGQTHRVGGPEISVHSVATILDFLERNGVAGEAALTTPSWWRVDKWLRRAPPRRPHR